MPDRERWVDDPAAMQDERRDSDRAEEGADISLVAHSGDRPSDGPGCAAVSGVVPPRPVGRIVRDARIGDGEKVDTLFDCVWLEKMDSAATSSSRDAPAG